MFDVAVASDQASKDLDDATLAEEQSRLPWDFQVPENLRVALEEFQMAMNFQYKAFEQELAGHFATVEHRPAGVASNTANMAPETIADLDGDDITLSIEDSTTKGTEKFAEKRSGVDAMKVAAPSRSSKSSHAIQKSVVEIYIVSNLPEVSSNELPAIRKGLEKKVRHWVHGPIQTFMCITVAINCFTMAIKLQFSGYVAADTLGLAPSFDYRGASDAFGIVELGFVSLFMAEILLRAIVDGKQYFQVPTNYADAAIAIASLLNEAFESTFANLSFLRFFRLMRVVRSLRMVKGAARFRHLRVLGNTLKTSAMSFLWSMVVILLSVSFGAIFGTQMLQSTVKNESLDPAVRKYVYDQWGTTIRAFWTMFECSFTAAWVAEARFLLDEVSWAWGVFWLFHVCFINFAMFKITSSMFLKEALSNASSDLDTVVHDHIEKTKAFNSKLRDMVFKYPTVTHGEMTYEEMETMVADSFAQTFFTVMQLRVSDPGLLWRSIPHSNPNCMTVTEFVDGIHRQQMQTPSHDLFHVLQHCTEILACSASAQDTTDQLLKEVKAIRRTLKVPVKKDESSI